MKTHVKLALLFCFALVFSGCAKGPKFQEIAAQIADPGPGEGRIYIYRTNPMGAAVQPEVRVNDEVVGKAVPGGFMYLDRPPGSYEVATSTEVTRKLTFMLDSGQTRYVRLNISMGFFVGHVYPELIDNAQGAQEILNCGYIYETLPETGVANAPPGPVPAPTPNKQEDTSPVVASGAPAESAAAPITMQDVRWNVPRIKIGDTVDVIPKTGVSFEVKVEKVDSQYIEGYARYYENQAPEWYTEKFYFKNMRKLNGQVVSEMIVSTQ